MVNKDENSQKPTWMQTPTNLRDKLQLNVSRLTNGFIKSPFFIRSLQYHRSKDSDVRRESEIEEDQKAYFWSVTSIEYYTPEFINNLERGLANLKAAQGHWSTNPLGSYAKEYRGSVGSSFELHLSIPTADSFTNIGHLSELPKFCSSAQGSVINITPSLTALIITFFVSDEQREQLNAKVHQTYPVKLEELEKGAIQANDSRAQQRKIVETFKQQLASQIDGWFSSECPGVYAIANRERPVCFTVSTGSIVPYFSEKPRSSILDRLDMTDSAFVFRPIKTSVKVKQDAIFFSPSVFHDRGNYSYICGSDTSFDRLDSKHWGSDSVAPFRYLDEITQKTLGMWWCKDLLRMFRREAVGVRDRMHQTMDTLFPMSSLSSLQKEMARLSEGATIANDLKTYLNRSSHFFEFDAFLFNSRDDTDQKSIKMIFKESVDEECELTVRELSELHSHIISQSNIASSRQSLKLQYLVIILSIVAVIASLVSLLFAAQRV
tara:strand:- start:12 stop:1487 length:1476 start_codon:yes stop_codon:yes gene_type:complete